MCEREDYLNEEMVEGLLLEISKDGCGLAVLWNIAIEKALVLKNRELLKEKIRELEQLAQNGKLEFRDEYDLLRAACLNVWVDLEKEEEEKQL